MKVWILQTGEPLQIDSAGLRPMRAINLSKALTERGHDVVLWSSDFDHFSKRHRQGTGQAIKVSPHLEIRLIKSRGYTSHFGLSRLIDHAQLGWNLHKMLRVESGPDVTFIGYPPIEPAWVMARWLKKKKIPSVLDIKDAWPEIFLRACPKFVRPLIRLLLTPYFLAMRSSFKSVTALSSVTDAFLTWSVNVSGRKENDMNIVNYLTVEETELAGVEHQNAQHFLKENGIYDSSHLRVIFVGTLNSAFDFEPIFSAAETLPIEFIIAGSGPLYNQLQERAKKYTNIKLIGWVTGAQAKVLISSSTFMLAPYRDLPDFDIHIPNKFFDAMCQGIPLLTSITGLAKRLVEDENIGLTYSVSGSQSLREALLPLMDSPNKICEMSKNAKELYKLKYSFEKVYGDCVTHLELLAKQ